MCESAHLAKARAYPQKERQAVLVTVHRAMPVAARESQIPEARAPSPARARRRACGRQRNLQKKRETCPLPGCSPRLSTFRNMSVQSSSVWSQFYLPACGHAVRHSEEARREGQVSVRPTDGSRLPDRQQHSRMMCRRKPHKLLLKTNLRSQSCRLCPPCLMQIKMMAVPTNDTICHHDSRDSRVCWAGSLSCLDLHIAFSGYFSDNAHTSRVRPHVAGG